MAEEGAGLRVRQKEKTSVVIWPNPGPLECGVLGSGAGKFTLNSLKKLLSYAKGKGEQGYPWLSYSVWSHVAKSRLHLSEELAWLFFETFDVIIDVDPKERLKFQTLLSRHTLKEDVKRKVSVDVCKFVLYLYIQNVPHLSLKAPLMVGDDWPSPEAERKHKSYEYAHFSFLKTHLSSIIDLLCEKDPDSGVDRLSLHGLRGLDFLLSATIGKKVFYSLEEITMHPTEATQSGFCKETKMFAAKQFEQWLQSNFALNPFGPLALKSGSRDKRCPCFRSDRIGRAATNLKHAPENYRNTLLHRVNKQTLAMSEEMAADNRVYIQHSQSSSIYLLAPMKAVQVEKCSRCLIVLGAVETVVKISNCENLTVVAVCRRLHISSSSKCTFHLLTATKPVISPISLQITFAPYNTHYPSLERHIQRCGMLKCNNYWNQPTTLETTSVDSCTWCVMSPECFRVLSIPFVVKGDTKDVPCPFPKEYEAVLSERKQRIHKWHALVKSVQLSDAESKQLQVSVQEKFQSWMEKSGHKKEVVDLDNMKLMHQ